MPTRLTRESLETLLSLADMLPGALYRCRNDAHWTMDFLSGGAHELTGYTIEAFVDQRDVSFGVDVIVEADQGPVWDAVQAGLAKGSTWEIEYRIRRSDGQIRWVWEQGHGVFAAGGALEFLVGFIVDIEDRKRAEAILTAREAEIERKNQVIDALSLPVLEIAEGTLVVPLIGELAAHRATQLLEVVLARISSHGAKLILVDITGLAEVSSESAAALVGLARASRLLGARCILTGVRPQVAQLLVRLDVPLAELQTAGSLKDGLALR